MKDIFLANNSKAEVEELDLAVAEFVYGSNNPFNIAENPAFLKMIQKLRPGYSPPSRARLAGDLLDKVNNW